MWAAQLCDGNIAHQVTGVVASAADSDDDTSTLDHAWPY